MIYRVSYEDGSTVCARQRHDDNVGQTEEFSTEHEALERALKLLEDGDHHAVSLREPTGNVVQGVCLQLRLGFNGD